jgi:hypothetical protein
MVTAEGRMRAALLELKLTTKATPAALVSVTVHDADPPEAMLDGHATEDSAACAVTASEKVRTTPPEVALRTTVTSVDTAEAVAVNVALVDAAGIVRLGGTVTLGLLLVSVTGVPPAGAAWVRLTVQVDVPGPVTGAGVHERLLSWLDGGTLTVAVLVIPAADAATVTDTREAGAPAVAFTFPDVAPLETVTEAGTVRAALLELNATEKPPEGAVLFKVAVQTPVVFGLIVAGQVNEESCVGDVSARANVRLIPLAEAVIVAVTSAPTAAAVAVKVPVVAEAATVTDEGTVTLALLLDSDTVIPPAWAGRLSDTVQVEVPGPWTEAGAHDTLLSCGSAETTTVSVRVTPLAPAVTVTVWSLDTDPAVAVKLALLAPFGTETEEGTVSAALLLDRLTAKLPVAFLLSVTEQEIEAPAATLAGHATELNVTGAVSVTENVRVTPFADAVMIAVMSEATAAVEAAKVAAVDDAATVTDAGTVTLALLLDKDTARPPATAGRLRVTVQVDDAGPCTEAGVHDKLLNWGNAETITVSVWVTPFALAVTVTV